MSTPVIRQATADDLVAYFGAAPKQSMRAYVAVVDGKPVGIAASMGDTCQLWLR